MAWRNHSDNAYDHDDIDNIDYNYRPNIVHSM